MTRPPHEHRPGMPSSPRDGEARQGLRHWVCTCGYHATGATQPDSCPQCGANRHEFRRE